jgi:hypothetical protein
MKDFKKYYSLIITGLSMMKRSILLSIAALLLFSGVNAFAQSDARTVPYYMQPDFIYNNYYTGFNGPKINKLLPDPMPKDYVKTNVDRIMNEENGIELINCSNLESSQSETWMAINPANPLNMIATANDMYYNNASRGYKMSAFYTMDGGKTWEHSTTPKNQNKWISMPSQGGATNFDPGIVFDTKGNCFYSYGFTQTLHGGDDEADNGVFVCKSTDGGKSWSEPMAIAYETGGSVGQPFHDRYTITADQSPDSPMKDNLYIAWKRFKVDPQVLFSRSTDGGESWYGPYSVPGGGGATQSPIPAVGPDGTVYVCFQKRDVSSQKTSAIVAWSTNAGDTWLGPEEAIKVYTIGEINTESYRNTFPTKQNMRVSSAPVIAVDNSNSPRRGNIYVVIAGKDSENGLTRLYIARSMDGGMSWTDPQRIDNNELGNDIFFPAISIDPVTGLIGIMYYSSQNDPNNQGVDAYVAISRDGENFSTIRLTPESTYIKDMSDISVQGTGNFYWGDYTSVVAYDGIVYPLFWWPTAANGNFWSLDLFTAPLSGRPREPENVELVNQVDGDVAVMVNWDDPETNMLNEPLPDFKIHIYRDGEKITEVEKGIEQYLDTEVLDGVQYQYALKTVTVDNDESKFVNAYIRAGGEFQPNAPKNLAWQPAEGGTLLSWDNPAERIDGSQFTDLARIDVYIGEEKVHSIDHSIAAGERTTALIPLETENYHKIRLRAVGSRGETEPLSVYSEEVIAYAGLPLTYLDEDFDDVTTLTPIYNNSWAVTDAAANSAPNSFTDSPDGEYENNTNNYFMFAPAVVRDDATTLSFEHIALIRKLDHGSVDISNDMGKTWKSLHWFDDSHSDKFGDDISTSEFVSEDYDLSEYVGDTLIVAFSMVSNFVGASDGWYIDDVMFNSDPVTVDEETVRSGLKLEASPNPTESATEITAVLPAPGSIRIALYDNLGNEIANIGAGNYDAGRHTFPLDMNGLSSGVYYTTITFEGRHTATIPVVLAK